MIIFQNVMQRIKEILIQETEKKKILDRDIAAALSLEPQYFAVIKRRNKIPYESIAYFCKTRNVSMNWILMEQKPPYLT